MLNAKRNPLRLCSDHWPLRAGETSPWGVPAFPLPWPSPSLKFEKQVRVCSVLGVPYSERPIRELIPGPTQCGMPPPPPPHTFSAIQEHPGHEKPNLKGSQRPGLQQSELENVTIVPLETQVRESETP